MEEVAGAYLGGMIYVPIIYFWIFKVLPKISGFLVPYLIIILPRTLRMKKALT